MSDSDEPETSVRLLTPVAHTSTDADIPRTLRLEVETQHGQVHVIVEDPSDDEVTRFFELSRDVLRGRASTMAR